MIDQLVPAYKDYLWGGHALQELYGKHAQSDTLAESWELSCHPDGPCVLQSTGETLQAYLSRHPEASGTACAGFPEFPVLVKLIDAAKPLSVQVHPDNAYARAHEGQAGKTEMWYILEAKPGAFLYYGVEEEMTGAEFRAAIEKNELEAKLHKRYVKKGDVVFIEAGTVHAIGAGIVLAEVQQSSNVTYRVYDYGRVGADGKPRPLHIEKACEVASLMPARTHYNFHGHLAQCESFTVDELDVEETAAFEAGAETFHALLITSGTAHIACGEKTVQAGKGECVFVSAGSGAVTLQGNCRALHIYVNRLRYRVGIDLGGTNIKVGVVNNRDRIVATRKCKTLVGRPWQEIVGDMGNAVFKALDVAGITTEDCDFLGIGSPGTIDVENGEVVYANNFGWEHIPVAKTLHQTTGLPVYLSNDANCAALGEFVAGAAEHARSTVLLTLGTGVGGGVVFDGKIFEGGGPGGAELGHTTLLAGGERCTCGRKGCIEAYCSATALIREAKKAAQSHPESSMNTLCEGDLERMDGRIPFDAARAGDAAAAAVVHQYIEWLGESIVNMVNIFRPEVVLLSGGICGEGRYLTDPLNAYVRQYAYAGERVPIPEVRRALLGNDAGIIGAANLH